MSYRYMRIIVFFDLPSITYDEKKEYRRFHKLLIEEGFIMMQESVYSKLALNRSVVELVKAKLLKGKPKKGLAQVMTITEKQFADIEYIVGGSYSEVLDTTERLIIL